jgi:hypothetical protein
MEDIQKLTKGMVYYMPKALTILSHYSFYTLYSKFLQQIYHVSLSNSPLPIERYILNFIRDLPLPPQGRIEVLYSLPESQLSITRPLKNQLPMIDFSYRPLFTCLSIDSILTVFNCLCLEMTICITSRNIALLTPIQETFLSLLFPFIWQGCYVPILPISMIEMLDAPVPLLTGINLADLETVLRENPSAVPASENIVLVDLDNDRVQYGLHVGNSNRQVGEEGESTGNNNNGLIEERREILPLPKSKLSKLNSKLEEYGGIIHKKDYLLAMKAGYPFLNNEHLVPIKSFLYEQGTLTNNANKQHGSSHFTMKNLMKKGIRGTFLGGSGNSSNANVNQQERSLSHDSASSSTATLPNKNEGGGSSEGLPFRHPCACTIVVASSVTTDPSHHSHSSSASILDVENNYIAGEAFNAKEIREAFLRFFVACLIDYQDYFIFPNSHKGGSNKRRGSTTPYSPAPQSPAPSVDETASTLSHLDDLASEVGGNEIMFDHQGYSQHLQDDFLSSFIESQMFSNFISEKIDSFHHNAAATAAAAAVSFNLQSNQSKRSVSTSSPTPSSALLSATSASSSSSSSTNYEIFFFDEHILAKKNRSKLQLMKSVTPFLSEMKDALKDTFTVPLPSTFGIAENSIFYYSSFPSKLKITEFGGGNINRQPVILVDIPEKRRLLSHSQDKTINNYLSSLIHHATSTSSPNGSSKGGGLGGELEDENSSLRKFNKQLAERIRKHSSVLPSSSEAASAASSTLTSSARHRLLKKSLSMDPETREMERQLSKQRKVHATVAVGSPTIIERDEDEEEKRFYHLTREYYYYLISCLVTIQSCFRRRKHYSRLKKVKNAIRTIQLFYHYYHIKRYKQNTRLMISLLLIQKIYRGYQQKKKYHSFRKSLIFLQSIYRKRKLSRFFQLIRKKIVILQAVFRCFLQQKRFLQFCKTLIEERKHQISLLWIIERTSLYYRAIFYTVMNNVVIPSPKVISPSSSATDGGAKRKKKTSTSMTSKSNSSPFLCCLALAFYDEECLRLYDSLGFSLSNSPFYIKGFDQLSSIQQKYEAVYNHSKIKQLLSIMKELPLSTSSGSSLSQDKNFIQNDNSNIKNNILKINNFLLTTYQSTSTTTTSNNSELLNHYLLSLQQETIDRNLLYTIFQNYTKESLLQTPVSPSSVSSSSSSTSTSLKINEINYFFQIENHKRRKRKISQYIFMNSSSSSIVSSEYQHLSSSIVLTLLNYYHRKNPSIGGGGGGGGNRRERLQQTKTLSLQFPVSIGEDGYREWLNVKKQQLLTKHSLEVIKACLMSVEKLRKTLLEKSKEK